VDESMLQGVHRPGIRLSVEEIVQRNKSEKESSGGRVAEIFKERNP
jgi:hypothetical protein